ncbi:MAG: FtsX-like permease family protein, partial [Alphaproteobacteria bacterium]|nr:FtsX-like permease family protein [Alphaproteobacteria bacterium]
LLLGAGYGVLITLAFSVITLGRMHTLSVSSLFRGIAGEQPLALKRRYIALAGLCAAAFAALMILTSFNRTIAAIYFAGTVAIFVLLRLFGYGVICAARSMRQSGNPGWRLAMANIARPGALTQSVVLSIGLGLSLLVALVTIDANFREPLRRGVPGETPSFFFLDIQKQQAAEFAQRVKTLAPDGIYAQVPMMRGRLVHINGKEPSTIRAAANIRWVLEGDRGITYASQVPEGSTLSQGSWWSADYNGPPLVSMESAAAEGLGLKIGDTVTVNIAGRNITARIANLRDVNWQTFGMNFVFVFTPSTLAAAPHTFLSTVTFPSGLGGEQEASLAAGLGRSFPSVSIVRIKDTLETIAAIARQLSLAIQGATGIGLLASILVLAGAFSAGLTVRRYDAVMMKVLGASRGKLLSSYIMEFGTLSLVSAAFAAIAGLATAWTILKFVAGEEDFLIPWLAIGSTVAAAIIVTLALGLAGTGRLLTQKPGPALRSL